MDSVSSLDNNAAVMRMLYQMQLQKEAAAKQSAAAPAQTGQDSASASAAAASFPSGGLSIDSSAYGMFMQCQQADGAASAAPPSPQDALDNLFGSLDADGSGGISQSELETAFSNTDKSQVDAMFSQVDSDGDGKISEAELQKGLTSGQAAAHHGHHHGSKTATATGDTDATDSLFASLDTDSDGSVSETEMEAAYSTGQKSEVDKLFASLDTNGSGGVSAAELTQGIQSAKNAWSPPPGMFGMNSDGASGMTTTAAATATASATGSNAADSAAASTSSAFAKAIQAYLSAQYNPAEAAAQAQAVFT